MSACEHPLDPPSQCRHCRMAELNLLAAIVICWNRAHTGEGVRQRKLGGLIVESKIRAHISPLG